MNKLNHDRTLANLKTEASYARNEKRWTETAGKHARNASRRYNKACRKASKIQLQKLPQKPIPIGRFLIFLGLGWPNGGAGSKFRAPGLDLGWGTRFRGWGMRFWG